MACGRANILLTLLFVSAVCCLAYLLIGGSSDTNLTSFATPITLQAPLSIVLQTPDDTNNRLQVSPAAKLPQKILIVSTWRSGSSTFAGLLASHKDVFLHYEPLDGHEVGALTDPATTDYVSDITNNLLNCEYQAIEKKSLKVMYNTRPYLEKNFKLPAKCRKSRPVQPNNPCLDAAFISEQCTQYPIQMAKYVRISLQQVKHYIQQDNFKIIWLARDPRAVWYSRQNNKMVKFWCLSGLCGDLKRLCQSYQINLDISDALSESNPSHFMRVNFEDVQASPFKEIERITQFLGLEGSPEIHSRVEALMDRTNFTTTKDWRGNLSDKIRWEVEAECSDTMHRMGYLSDISTRTS